VRAQPATGHQARIAQFGQQPVQFSCILSIHSAQNNRFINSRQGEAVWQELKTITQSDLFSMNANLALPTDSES
jgi:hypothetical protein